MVVSHADRPVTLAVRRGRAVIVKRYRNSDPVPVFDAMVDLWASPFGAIRSTAAMPEPLGLDGDELTMAFVEGDAAADAVADHSADAARLLVDLHASGVTVPLVRDTRRLQRSLWRKAIDLAERHPEFEALLESIERRAADNGASGDLVVSHGDFSPRNVLVSTDGVVLIDFDRLQMAAPGRDVAYWGAWCWAMNVVIGDEPSWAAGDRFAEHYRDAGGQAAALPFHRAMALVRIAHGWSAFRDDPHRTGLVLAEANAVLA